MVFDLDALIENESYITDETKLYLIKKANIAISSGGGALHTRKKGVKAEDCETLITRTFTEEQLRHFRPVTPCGDPEPVVV